MEIELDVDVKRSARDLTFISVENETVFVLLGHLPGFMQDKIATSINEVRQEICICGVGDKAFSDMAIGGRLRLKNEFETNSFKKVFGIPNGVALDQIEVCFNEDDAILMILMPKSIDIEGEVGERGTREIVKEGDALIASSKVEEDEETEHEEVDESNEKFDPPKWPSAEIKAPNIEQQSAKAKGEQTTEEKHNGQPSKEDESPRTSEANQALDQPKISQNIDTEREEQEKQEDKKGGVGESHELKEEDEEQVHELDDKPIYEKGLPQQLIEELETSNEDKLPMKEVKGNGSQKEKGIVDGRETQEIDEEREASDVNQTLGHPKTSQNVDKEHEEEREEREDMKRGVGKSQEMKEEDEEQVHELDDKPIYKKGLPQQLIEELETSNKDKLPMKEVVGNGSQKEKGIVDGRETQEIDGEREASDVIQTLGHPKTSQNVDKEHEEEREEREDTKRGVDKSQEMKEEDEEQVHELDDKPIYKKGLPQQLIEELETSNKDKLPMKEVEGNGSQKEKGIVDGRETQEIDGEREASDVNQTLGHPKISQNVDKEHEEEREEREDTKRGVDKSQEMKEEDEEQVHELDDKPIYKKGLPQQLIEELETSNKDKLPMKEVEGNGSQKEKGIVDGRETQEIDGEREASDVNQTLGHPKTSQNVDKEHGEEREDTKRGAGKSQGMKEEDEEQRDNKGLPRQLIQELDTSKKDESSTKEMKGKKRKKEQGGGLGVPPPSLVVSAFLLSLAALVIKLVRNQKRT